MSTQTTNEPGALCPTCDTRTVRFTRHDPPGIQLFQCANCKEVKRWCPWCGQGWLVHYVVDEDPRSRYICDECVRVWDSHWKPVPAHGGPYLNAEAMGSNGVAVRDIELP